jgi:hypothetical protein
METAVRALKGKMVKPPRMPINFNPCRGAFRDTDFAPTEPPPDDPEIIDPGDWAPKPEGEEADAEADDLKPMGVD